MDIELGDISANKILKRQDTIVLCLNNTNVKYEKETFESVKTRIDKTYMEKNSKYSAAMDILASYVKGQKIIYMESKYYLDMRLNMLMLPSIFITAACSVMSSHISEYGWGIILISGLNGLITFLFT